MGNPVKLQIDVGPIITSEAQGAIAKHIEAMKAKGHAVTSFVPSSGVKQGSFVPPTVIEIDKMSELKREVFGPVLHVLRYQREDLDRLLSDINATGYGLTFGLHTRLDETIAHVSSAIHAGNIYINRNTVGAVVGVQPFGGHGLSGTGPKAGGPLYLRRLVKESASSPNARAGIAGPGGRAQPLQVGATWPCAVSRKDQRGFGDLAQSRR